MILLGLAIVMVTVSGCGPTTAQPRSHNDSWFDDDAPSDISSNLDAAEVRWRKEIERDRGSDPLLTDDPPGAPENYGTITSEDAQDMPGDPTSSAGFWNKFGKASFALVSVLVALGMMAAPYFLAV
jgi:hypothetical protein